MRIPVKTAPGRILLLDADDIYYIESDRDDTWVRTAGRRRHRSLHALADWEKRLAGAGFLRIHRSYLVNAGRVRELRLRGDDPNDWEVKLDPPVNAVLPVGRTQWARVRRAPGLAGPRARPVREPRTPFVGPGAPFVAPGPRSLPAVPRRRHG